MTTTRNDCDRLADEWADWLRRQSSAVRLGDWTEITVPVLDESNDGIRFYAKRAADGTTTFTDDGYTLELFDLRGVTMTPARSMRAAAIARRYGARIDGGQIVLDADGDRGDAMNRYVQALAAIGGVAESAQRRVSEYFAEDVAARLDECNVFYTQNVGVRGLSSYEHSFDFVFQRSARHPTRFCQAPNSLTKATVERIMFGWDDTSRAPEREESRLVVIGDDRDGTLPAAALSAFDAYGVDVIPWSQLADRAPQELAA